MSPRSPALSTDLPSAAPSLEDLLEPGDSFLRRHLGPSETDQALMLKELGYESLDALVDEAVPEIIRLRRPLALPEPRSEQQALEELRVMASKNQVRRSFIGMGYHDCITPPVIQRNILENPGWYTAYTPYQAEISQGRLEALLNFQSMIIDLTGMEIANASLLDEGTAAAEAITMCWGLRPIETAHRVFVSELCHPQTIAVVQTRCEPLEIEVVIGDHRTVELDATFFAVLVQYPATNGTIFDYQDFLQLAHQHRAMAIVAADILALTVLRPPGEFGADIVVGTTQRFGVPMGFGGPHAAFLSTRDAFKRQMPGRLIGVSRDAQGNPALRLSLQTREQHIRRDKATSNICTAQVLLAVMASMYAVYHGPQGLRRIARRVHYLTCILARGLQELGRKVSDAPFFDTVYVALPGDETEEVRARAEAAGLNLRYVEGYGVGISMDETSGVEEVDALLALFSAPGQTPLRARKLGPDVVEEFDALFARTTPILAHPIFNSYHTETEMLRYIRRLESRDISLTNSMIPLGSCTMKLNATVEMFPVTWPEFCRLHPFAPRSQFAGYQELFRQLEEWLAEITGFASISLQPNAGSQGEYAGLLAIQRYHQSRHEGHRQVCLIPLSAHGTNPASAVMVGFKVVPVACDERGNIDLQDLRAKAQRHASELAALMVTYPSTHGVFEETIKEVCAVIHEFGGQVYMDGANLNAQVGLCRPGDIGVDVCHLNLHKTFCIPHGGGGPGVGPIGVQSHLVGYLPGHSVLAPDDTSRGGAVSSAPWGSALILTISWMYIRLLGGEGLTIATKVAILGANYLARRLSAYFPVLYTGLDGMVAHECILDFRGWKERAGLEVEDIAKRLMDYGFHAPTMSWPVPGTLMIEPTESESKAELDRFCEAMISIHGEMIAIENGTPEIRKNNALKNAPHTVQVVAADHWDRPYPRELAAFPVPGMRAHKIWPYVGRIDNVHGDRHLVCSCLPVDSYAA